MINTSKSFEIWGRNWFRRGFKAKAQASDMGSNPIGSIMALWTNGANRVPWSSGRTRRFHRLKLSSSLGGTTQEEQ